MNVAKIDFKHFENKMIKELIKIVNKKDRPTEQESNAIDSFSDISLNFLLKHSYLLHKKILEMEVKFDLVRRLLELGDEKVDILQKLTIGALEDIKIIKQKLKESK